MKQIRKSSHLHPWPPKMALLTIYTPQPITTAFHVEHPKDISFQHPLHYTNDFNSATILISPRPRPVPYTQASFNAYYSRRCEKKISTTLFVPRGTPTAHLH